MSGKDWPFPSPWAASQRGQGSTRLRTLGLKVSHKPWGWLKGEEIQHNLPGWRTCVSWCPTLVLWLFVTVLHCPQCQKSRVCIRTGGYGSTAAQCRQNTGQFNLESQLKWISNLTLHFNLHVSHPQVALSAEMWFLQWRQSLHLILNYVARKKWVVLGQTLCHGESARLELGGVWFFLQNLAWHDKIFDDFFDEIEAEDLNCGRILLQWSCARQHSWIHGEAAL